MRPSQLGRRLRAISDQALASGTPVLSADEVSDQVAATRSGRPAWMRTRYAYRTDHVLRALLALSLSINLGLALLVWVLIGLMEVMTK